MLLLDTHAALWFFDGDERIPLSLRQKIENEVQAFVSIASLWEIAIKVGKGKLELDRDLEGLNNAIHESDTEISPIEYSHLRYLTNLPQHHHDPFDRVLISQAQVEGLTLVSRDTKFALYDGLNATWK